MTSEFENESSPIDHLNQRIDALASDWLDDRAPINPAEDISDLERARLADLAFLDVLLERIHACDPRATDARVQRAMAAISDEAPQRLLATPSARYYRWRTLKPLTVSSFTAAAILLLLLTLYWPIDSARTAYAAVQRAYLDASRLKDRQYRITTELRISSNHMMSIESLLTVRGGEKFTLRHPVMFGQCWIGSNGRQGWFIPAIGVPKTEGDPVIVMEWVRKQGVELPDMHVNALIEFLEEHFELELLPSEKLPEEGDILWQRVRGTTRSHQAGKLQFVELWAHPKTGIARKILLKWDRKPQDLGITQISLDLAGEQQMPDSWYEPTSHQPLPVLPLPPIVPSLQQ